MALAEMGFGLNGIGLNGYWPNWELDQVALDEMALDEMGLDEVAIPLLFNARGWLVSNRFWLANKCISQWDYKVNCDSFIYHRRREAHAVAHGKFTHLWFMRPVLGLLIKVILKLIFHANHADSQVITRGSRIFWPVLSVLYCTTYNCII